MERSTVKEEAMEYPLSIPGADQTKGLFVIIRQQLHRFSYEPRKLGDYCWALKPQLDYSTDQESILKAFGLEEKFTNVLIGENRTNADGGDASFDHFMDEKVCKYGEVTGQNPSFVMFFLMSHGFENGDFLLADYGISGQSKEQCCQRESKHSLKDKCFARNLTNDVISKLHNCYKDIPKIFINQCCRGSDDKNLEGRDPPQPFFSAPSDTELFIPKYSDTLVLNASLEGYKSYVRAESAGNKDTDLLQGSMLLQSFCETIEELKNNNQQYDQLLSKIEAQEGAQGLYTNLEKRREDAVGGWMMNVCQRTIAGVTNKLLVDIILAESAFSAILTKAWKDLDRNLKAYPKLIKNRLTNAVKTVAEEIHLPADDLTLLIRECENQPWPILAYMWANVRRLKNTFPLQLSSISAVDAETLRASLEAIVDELKKPEAFCKQQPIICSSLSKRLSVVKILGIQH